MTVIFHFYLLLALSNAIPVYIACLEFIAVPLIIFMSVVFVLGTIFTTPSKYSVIENRINS